MDEKHLAIQAALELEELGDDRFDPTTESGAPPPRPFLLLHASVIGLSMALIVFVEMLCVSKVIHSPSFLLLSNKRIALDRIPL